ncbi:MAG: M3 family oligoendopeptidase [Candidatus Thorarchaeota archaeon]
MGDDEAIPEWDLSPLVDSTNPDDVKKALDLALAEIQKLECIDRDGISTNTPQEIRELFESIDATMPRFYQLFAYTHLLVRLDITNNVSKDLYEFAAKYNSKVTSIYTTIELEITKALKEQPELVDDPILSEYRHALEKLRQRGLHFLSEIEEKLIIEKDHYGIDAWQKLHTELRSTREYTIRINDEEKKLALVPLFNLAISHPDRAVRKTASEVFHNGLTEDRLIWAFALKSIFGDHLSQTKARNYPDVLAQSLLDNDIERECLDALIETIKNNVALIHRYLRIKAKILKLPELTTSDVYASVNVSDATISWDEARQLVEQAYSNFHTEFASWIKDLFTQNKIDAKSRSGKVGTGFCGSVFTLQTSWIMIDYQGSLTCLSTLAHEAGHALHRYLSAKNQTWTNSWTGSCLGETASIFGELLLNEVLAKKRTDTSDRVTQLCNTMDRFRLNVFDMLIRFIFESNVFTTLENNGNIDADILDTLWVSAKSEVFGEVVDWVGMEGWWAYLVHHFKPRFRYYNYPYAFGQLLVYALYGLYKEQGDAFVPKMKQILSAGGSKTPKDLLAGIGLDLSDTKFWEIGFKQAEAFVDELETLVK